jgi:hypothetical protein
MDRETDREENSTSPTPALSPSSAPYSPSLPSSLPSSSSLLDTNQLSVFLTDFFLSLLPQAAVIRDVSLEDDLIKSVLLVHFTPYTDKTIDVKSAKGEKEEEEEDEFFGCGEVIDDKAVCERAASESFNTMLFGCLSSWRESSSENIETGAGGGGGGGDTSGNNTLEKNGYKLDVKSSSSTPENGDSTQNGIKSSLAVTSIFIRAWLNGSYLHYCSISSSSANVSNGCYDISSNV